MLDSLHKSILWIVRMSVLHDFCRAWFRVTEGRTWSVHLKCIQTVPTCCGPLKPQCLLCQQLRLRAYTCHSEGVWKGAALMETSLLSHQLLSCSLFLILQEAPRGRCLDCHCSVSPSFHTVFNSHMLFLPSLSMFISIKANAHKHSCTHFILFSLSPLLIHSTRGWVVCTPGQIIWFLLSPCETVAIPQ